MTSLTFDDYCRAIVSQTELLRAQVRGVDTAADVSTCPGWDLGRLLRHVGGDHRWADEVVRTRALEPVPGDPVDDPAVYAHLDGDALDDWLGEGAAELGATLRDAGPDARVWTPAHERNTAAFWARRMTHETLVHRADAALATGASFTVDDGLAADAVDEWMDFATVPEAYEPRPAEPDLLGPGRTLQFEATGAGQWHVDLGGDRPVWHPGRAEAAATVRAPVTELLLFLYRRPAPAVETHGDTALLELWLTRTGFWLEA
ncbi:maleylpyruvate isomerase family mycothiol-dependent enzyme [Streptomyces sp. NPDC001401]|uniref:maleylpyruvate isomerase family mycothiol-dependent enzyme n=1 Tax=Streptomyces sp. NPDC001401 TaxID=3364570 RepID=UPI00367CE157